jgi:predicted ester cyclase
VEIDFAGMTSSQSPVSFPAVDIFDIEDSQITNLSQWFDTAEVARQVDAGWFCAT